MLNMEKHWLRKRNIVLALVGSIVMGFVLVKTGVESYKTYSFIGNYASDSPRPSSLQNSALKEKYNAKGQNVRSQKSLQLKHETYNNKNWTILLTVNNAYFIFFRNWYKVYSYLHIDYLLIIVAEDDLVYDKLIPLKSERVSIEKSGHEPVDKTSAYGSKDFNKLVSQRPTHILRHLKRGVNILYSDIDTVWLQNPFPYFTGDFDMWIELDGINNYCTGLMAIKSNENCIRLIEKWEKSLQIKQEIDQTAFNRVVTDATIKISVLDSRMFPNGSQYFDKYSDEQRILAVVIHNNWIVGQDAKLKRFKEFQIWFVHD